MPMGHIIWPGITAYGCTASAVTAAAAVAAKRLPRVQAAALPLQVEAVIPPGLPGLQHPSLERRARLQLLVFQRDWVTTAAAVVASVFNVWLQQHTKHRRMHSLHHSRPQQPGNFLLPICGTAANVDRSVTCSKEIQLQQGANRTEHLQNSWGGQSCYLEEMYPFVGGVVFGLPHFIHVADNWVIL